LARPSFTEFLKELEIPSDIPKEIKCKSCGEPMYWTPVNKYIGFWIHKGKSKEICGGKNLVNPGKPLIAQNMKVYQHLVKAWNKILGGATSSGDTKDK